MTSTAPPGTPGAEPPPTTSTAPPGTPGGTGALLPLAGAVAAPTLGTPVDACGIDDDGCITCGDVAVALTVVAPGAYDARCRDELGREELVATELVGPVAAGDVLLVHAKVALERLAPADGPAAGASGEGDTHALR